MVNANRNVLFITILLTVLFLHSRAKRILLLNLICLLTTLVHLVSRYIPCWGFERYIIFYTEIKFLMSYYHFDVLF